jgi:hypothetical protein
MKWNERGDTMINKVPITTASNSCSSAAEGRRTSMAALNYRGGERDGRKSERSFSNGFVGTRKETRV